METATFKTITSVFSTVSEFSKCKETDSIKESESSMNKFLDELSKFNNVIEERTSRIIGLNSQLQVVTHIPEAKGDDLILLKEMLDASKRAHGKLIRYYAKNSWTITKGLSAKVMHSFKDALDDWKEYNEDIEDKFIILADDQELQTTSEELKSLVSKKYC